MGASAAPYTGSGSAWLDLKKASPSDPATMFSVETLYTIVGRGGGLGAGNNGAQDDLSYYCASASADGTFTCRVRYLNGTKNDSGSAGAGIMLRSSLRNDARNVAALLTDGNGVTFQWRGHDGSPEESWPMSIAIGVSAPIWVQVTKKGHRFTVQYSQDGAKWYNPTSTNIVWPSGPYYVGLASTSHDTARGGVDLLDYVSGFKPHLFASISPS